MGALLFFITPTMAVFTDTETLVGIVTANKKVENWDGSILVFTGQGGNCSQGIFADVKNDSNSHMKGTSTYFVYFNSNGNPNNWIILESGTISDLRKNNTQRLTYNPTQSGLYKFKALQRPGYTGDIDPWSLEINVTCN
jgi:YqxM protein